jgi:signal transduction histidine kinase/DNA-binding response OmpR family regulator
MIKTRLFWIAYLVFLLNFVLNAQNLNAQNSNYHDSLKQKLNGAEDSVKLRLLAEAANKFQVINPDTSIILANQLLTLSQSLKDSANELEAISLLGRAYQNRSEFYKSSQYFYKAVAIAEKTKNTKKLASYHNSIGISLYYLKDYDKAIYHIQKAADLKLQANQIADYGTTMGNLAGVLHQLGRNKEAINTLKLAESKLKGKENKELLGNLYNTFGSIYQMGYQKLDSAEYFYRKALAMVQDEPDGVFILTAHTNIGMVCSSQNKLEEASFHLNEALKISKKLKRDIATLAIYESLSNLNAKKKNYEKAFQFRTLQLELNDSIFNSEKEKVVANLEAQYQNEKGKQIIQAQKLELEQSRNRNLWIVIILILLVFIVLALFVYFKFQSKVLKEVEIAKETFFSNVVHEIRSPISMIQAPIKLLQGKISDPEILNQLGFAERNLVRLNELINQMLLISKIEAKQFVINESYGNFNEFIAGVIEPYLAEAKQKQQHLTVNIQLGSTYFNFDTDAFQKIITNLLSNAIKYTPENGQIGIDITSIRQQLTLVVWDNGIGIENKDKEKVFDRFYRTKETVSSKQKGTGIGLSLVKSIVDALQGTIDLQSAKGEGSVFTLQIPIKLSKNELVDINLGTITVLLVEDDVEISAFNRQLLESNNYSVVTAFNGIEALQILKEQIPDIIVTDLMMPGMDGAMFLKEIRSNINTEHIPTIVLSAKTSVDARMEMLKLGAQAYLAKPFLPEEFLNLIASQLLMVKEKVTQFKVEVTNEIKTVTNKFKGSDPYTDKFFKIIFEQLDNSEFTVELFADMMATNRSHFQRKIKSLTGYSPSELIKMVRLEKSKELLLDKKGNITEVAYMCGFSSQSYFTKSFTQHFGKSPSQFLADNKSSSKIDG